MRIVHIINNLNKGGAERLLVDNLPFYKNAGIEVEVLQISNLNSEPKYIELLSDKGIRCRYLSTKSIYNPFLVFKLVRFLNKNEFGIVHVHLFPALYWVALATKFLKKRPKLVFTEHSTQNKRSKNGFLKPLETFIYQSYDSIIAISEQISNKLIAWTHLSEKIEIIPNGVDISRFREAEKLVEQFWMNEFSIPSGSTKLLMTARFSYPKDHFTLIKALSKLPDHYYLIFIGEGPNQDEVKALSNKLGLSKRTIFAGFRNDVPSLMKSADINILSTQYEGMSGVSLEALASGTPFLGSDVPGINDLVPDSRFLFKAGDPENVALKIRNLTDKDICKSMSSDGINHALKFDIAICINEHITLYSKVLTR